MRITVFGAAGSVGRRVVAEAAFRGHQVTAVGRDASRFPDFPLGVVVRTGDASKLEQVVQLSAGQDLVISATRPAPGHEHELAATAAALLKGLAKTGVRLLLVGGAAGLTLPGTRNVTVMQAPDYPPAWRPIAAACTEQLEVCRLETRVDWAYLSPPALLEPGERTGRYRIGADELLVDSAGKSRISMEDLAVALLDEAERPKHHQARFTVAY